MLSAFNLASRLQQNCAIIVVVSIGFLLRCGGGALSPSSSVVVGCCAMDLKIQPIDDRRLQNGSRRLCFQKTRAEKWRAVTRARRIQNACIFRCSRNFETRNDTISKSVTISIDTTIIASIDFAGTLDCLD
jgi:hypothetical protein